jgi:pyrimidine operon attenuation protein/uracil phosphoribosyltransferase
MSTVMESADIDRALRRIAHEIIEGGSDTTKVMLLGVPSRGVQLAQRLGAALDGLSFEAAVGTLDTRPYRDDLDAQPTRKPSRTIVPGEVEGTTVILVDDVLFTGRTIRAALDALVDLGRPARVRVAALIDRGHRELPIRGDYIGKNLPTAPHHHVAVRLREVDGIDGVWIEPSPAGTAAAR